MCEVSEGPGLVHNLMDRGVAWTRERGSANVLPVVPVPTKVLRSLVKVCGRGEEKLAKPAKTKRLGGRLHLKCMYACSLSWISGLKSKVFYCNDLNVSSNHAEIIPSPIPIITIQSLVRNNY